MFTLASISNLPRAQVPRSAAYQKVATTPRPGPGFSRHHSGLSRCRRCSNLSTKQINDTVPFYMYQESFLTSSSSGWLSVGIMHSEHIQGSLGRENLYHRAAGACLCVWDRSKCPKHSHAVSVLTSVRISKVLQGPLCR